jgi:ATP-dependent DNA helicase DinG
MAGDWRRILREQGYRLTPQRELVLDAVETLGHATPEEVCAEVRRTASGVNISTVYRTLELLEELGLVRCVHTPTALLFDPRGEEHAHAAAVVQVVSDLAYASDGGMFVLFTSHASLRRAATEVRAVLGTRWPILVQGESPRDVLLRRFREAENAILLGTDSFWEGVDVPGRALRALILNKLPFKVPTEPITAARLERLAEEGLDGFTHYLLPHAALKLKQGFGRLIRSRQDVGVVVLLDSRVVTKRYGPLLLGGLPRAERVIASWSTVRTRCEDFFAHHGIGATV